jgi:hypothetical protein
VPVTVTHDACRNAASLSTLPLPPGRSAGHGCERSQRPWR